MSTKYLILTYMYVATKAESSDRKKLEAGLEVNNKIHQIKMEATFMLVRLGTQFVKKKNSLLFCSCKFCLQKSRKKTILSCAKDRRRKTFFVIHLLEVEHKEKE